MRLRDAALIALLTGCQSTQERERTWDAETQRKFNELVKACVVEEDGISFAVEKGAEDVTFAQQSKDKADTTHTVQEIADQLGDRNGVASPSEIRRFYDLLLSDARKMSKDPIERAWSYPCAIFGHELRKRFSLTGEWKTPAPWYALEKRIEALLINPIILRKETEDVTCNNEFCAKLLSSPKTQGRFPVLEEITTKALSLGYLVQKNHVASGQSPRVVVIADVHENGEECDRQILDYLLSPGTILLTECLYDASGGGTHQKLHDLLRADNSAVSLLLKDSFAKGTVRSFAGLEDCHVRLTMQLIRLVGASIRAAEAYCFEQQLTASFPEETADAILVCRRVFAAVEKHYMLDLRDRVFALNLEKELENGDHGIAVFTGALHVVSTSPLVRLLEAKKIPYALLSPRIVYVGNSDYTGGLDEFKDALGLESPEHAYRMFSKTK